MKTMNVVFIVISFLMLATFLVVFIPGTIVLYDDSFYDILKNKKNIDDIRLYTTYLIDNLKFTKNNVGYMHTIILIATVLNIFAFIVNFIYFKKNRAKSD